MLDRLQRRPGSRQRSRRVGRGIGSGCGKTSGRGQKGAGARTGTRHPAYYEGGQLPLARRVPKRGFTNRFRVEVQVVNLRDLGRLEGAEVTPATLAAAGLVRRATAPVKLLAEGEVTAALRVAQVAVSAAARRKLEAAGGSVESLAPKPRPRRGGAR
jgi:large subunit ribosomal protein L15